jgi:hypothetical protein
VNPRAFLDVTVGRNIFAAVGNRIPVIQHTYIRSIDLRVAAYFLGHDWV